MKELSIEEKAKRYDEALKKAKDFYKGYKQRDNQLYADDLESIFPELKESEDENVRKSIIAILNNYVDNSNTFKPKMIAWLEKQGEKTSDKIVEKARTEKQRVLLTETDGSANIDWDCRSLDDVKILLKCGLEFIRTIEANKQILFDSRFGWCSLRVPTRYDKGIKQGEQKPNPCDGCVNRKGCINCENGELRETEHKPADKVEPKFHEGDFVVNGYGFIMKIVGIVEQSYQYIVIGSDEWKILDCPFSKMEKSCHLWDISNAKDGDVLAVEPKNDYPSPFIAIYKEHGLNFFNSHCFVSWDGEFHEGTTGHSISDIHPATKEQYDALMKAMANAGYTFDFEKKELKKIINKEQIKKNLQDNSFRRMFEQKPAWSEEDEKIHNKCISAMRASACGFTEEEKFVEQVDNWLKFLKYRYTWKPSDEQITWLYRAADDASKDSRMKQVLNNLLSDLKKLREG